MLNSINTGELGGRATLSPDGRHVLSWGKTTKLWDASTGQLLRTFDFKETICDAAFGSDGRIVATGCPGNSLLIVEVETGRIVKELKGHTKSVNSIAFLPDGSKLVSGGYDDTLRIWDLTVLIQPQL